jgi:TPR repeat protein
MHRFRHLRPVAAVAAAASTAAMDRRSLCQTRRGVSPGVNAELAKLRPGEAAMREKWEQDEDKWHLLPPRAWPPNYPAAEELDMLREKLVDEGCPPVSDIASGAAPLSEACVRRAFDLATCLLFNHIDPQAGVRTYRALAGDGDSPGSSGDPESMVAVGVALLEGLGVPRDETDGLRWLRRAAAAGSAQGAYELGVAYYTGLEDAGLACDEEAAFRLFETAACLEHTGALFMLADCLIDGSGCARDPARAVPLLHKAAERGHRLARAYLREWLDEDAEESHRFGLLGK